MKTTRYIMEMRTVRGRWVRACYPGGFTVVEFGDLQTLHEAAHDVAREWRGLTNCCFLDRDVPDAPFCYRVKEVTIIERYL